MVPGDNKGFGRVMYLATDSELRGALARHTDIEQTKTSCYSKMRVRNIMGFVSNVCVSSLRVSWRVVSRTTALRPITLWLRLSSNWLPHMASKRPRLSGSLTLMSSRVVHDSCFLVFRRPDALCLPPLSDLKWLPILRTTILHGRFGVWYEPPCPIYHPYTHGMN